MKTSENSNDYLLEKRLKELNPTLHRQFKDTVFCLQRILSKYRLVFPEYTDHSALHVLTVIDACNHVAGSQIYQLNGDEIYALLMGCYFHDVGMGITMNDFRVFSRNIDFGDYFSTHSRDDVAAIIRDFHHEYSGQFIRKYAEVFDIPSPEHVFAIIQIARGHRRVNLMDSSEYPCDFRVSSGNTICLPFLAALIRLADEIDVTASRNPILLYDIESLGSLNQIMEYRKVEAVKALEISEKSFVLYIDGSDRDVLEVLRPVIAKMQLTLDNCRKTVIGRTPYVITQERVITSLL